MQGSNPVDLILQLMSMGAQRGMPMEASSGLKQFLDGHGVSQLPTGEVIPSGPRPSGVPNVTWNRQGIAEVERDFLGWPVDAKAGDLPSDRDFDPTRLYPNVHFLDEPPDPNQLPDNLQYGPDGWPAGTESFKAPFQGPTGGNVLPFPERPPPISRDPWFDMVDDPSAADPFRQQLSEVLQQMDPRSLQELAANYGLDGSDPEALIQALLRDPELNPTPTPGA